MSSVQTTQGAVTAENLGTFSIIQLAAIYNELTGKTIKKFRDKTTAISRVQPVVAQRLVAPAPTFSGRKKFNVEPRPGGVNRYRLGTKRHKLIEALTKGATFEECMAATGWDYKVCYENIGLLNTYVGFGLREDENRVIRVYV